MSLSTIRFERDYSRLEAGTKLPRKHGAGCDISYASLVGEPPLNLRSRCWINSRVPHNIMR